MIKLKDMNQVQLILAIGRELGGSCTPGIESAMDFAARLHTGTTRKDPVQGRINTPYIEHCFRNLLRSARYRCTIEAVLIAIALHDVVEDEALKFAPHAASEAEARELLREYILAEYGPIVLNLVDAVTNPLQSRAERDAMSDAEKFALYGAKVAETIRKGIGEYIVKLVDIVDNAGSLHHTPEHEAPKARRLATKYLPVIEDFIVVGREYQASGDTSVDWDVVLDVLARIQVRLTEIIAAA